jgi:ATP phosphoribosyltransferase regulatory subunit
MNDTPVFALLPAGLHDLLPPDAERVAGLVYRAMAVFRGYGYERVKPPLVEFEDSLLSGVGRAWALQSFRLLDPDSQRMMAVRADMTLQVARLASSRLAKAARPLRLCYSGEVLRVGGAQLSPERQFHQIGCEMFGSLQPAADAEIILLAHAALSTIGVRGLSIDLNLPTTVPAIFAAYGVTGTEERRLAAALSHRDVATARAAPNIGSLLAALLDVSGPADLAIEKLKHLSLPPAAEASRGRLIETIRLIHQANPSLVLTVDPLERQGFEYQTGLSFTIFARGSRRELGRGGRYRSGGEFGSENGALKGEPAVGFSLFSDAILNVAPAEIAADRVYLPVGSSQGVAERLRENGWITISGLTSTADDDADARRLGCSHRLGPNSAEPVPLDRI